MHINNEELRKLYPGQSYEELSRIADTLDRYLALALEMYEEVEKEKTHARLESRTGRM